ncbi:MAG: ABC transporter permease, partial [Phycisphaerae bacterium]|nr:ABC transporter permease [Phycisphaerae bacterium]
IAVANVANLTLMRGVRRQPELVVRVSLGAGATRLRRLLLAENLLLTLGGSLLGSMVAIGGTGLLTALAARYSPRAAEVRLDLTSFLFALGLAIGVALLLSYLAAIPREGNVSSLVQAGGMRTSAGRGRQRVQRALVVVQVGVSVVLLAGAGLLTRTMLRLSQVETGLRTEEVLSLSVTLLTPTELLTSPTADAGAKEKYERMRSEAAGLPGVITAGIGSPGPLRSSNVRFEVKAEDVPPVPGVPLPHAELRTASPEFFQAAGIPLVRGREFAATDLPTSARVVVINEALAEQLFPGQDPVNRRVAWTGDVLRFTPISGEWRTIVGVVGNTKDGGLDATARPAMYLPFVQMLALGGSLVIRADSNVGTLVPAVTRIVRRIAPAAPIEDVLTIAQIREQSVAPRRLNAALISSFGILAVLIAAVGIAGVLAFAVSARTNEIGIRMSLGADAGRVQRMILREGGVLLAIGLIGGLVGASFATGLLRGLLFGVAPNDPLTLGSVAVAMAAVGLAACWIPATRAARIDPAITMRAQ